MFVVLLGDPVFSLFGHTDSKTRGVHQHLKRWDRIMKPAETAVGFNGAGQLPVEVVNRATSLLKGARMSS